MWVISLLPVLRVSDQSRRLLALVINYSRLIYTTNYSLRENRFIRFLIAGGVNTLFGFAVYSAAISTGTAVWLSLLAGTLAGTVFNFFTTGGYVFRELSLTSFYRFIICYLLVYVINLVLIDLLSKWVGNKIVCQLILTLPMAIFSYLLMARYVFFKKRNF